MEPKIIAYGKIYSMHDKGDRISCVLEVTPQEGFTEGLVNDDPYLENFKLKGDFKFGTRYEIVIREAAQQNLPLGRVFREEDNESVSDTTSLSPIVYQNSKRPSKLPKYKRDDFDEDEDELTI